MGSYILTKLLAVVFIATHRLLYPQQEVFKVQIKFQLTHDSRKKAIIMKLIL